MKTKVAVLIPVFKSGRGYKVLVGDEIVSGERKTKFFGGGLKKGESIMDGLTREWIEETMGIFPEDFYHNFPKFLGGTYKTKKDGMVRVYYAIFPEEYKKYVKNYGKVHPKHTGRGLFEKLDMKLIGVKELVELKGSGKIPDYMPDDINFIVEQLKTQFL